MASSRIAARLLCFATAAVASGWVSTLAAKASQGPGGGPGSASSFTQLAMAIMVYGTCAIVLLAGLIGAARGRTH